MQLSHSTARLRRLTGESGYVYIDLLRRFGCEYLSLDALPLGYTLPPEQPLFWPANFGVGVNPCVENGYYYPVKPMSYFCPVACGCRAGDKHCSDQCPARNAQVMSSRANIAP